MNSFYKSLSIHSFNVPFNTRVISYLIMSFMTLGPKIQLGLEYEFKIVNFNEGNCRNTPPQRVTKVIRK